MDLVSKQSADPVVATSNAKQTTPQNHWNRTQTAHHLKQMMRWMQVSDVRAEAAQPPCSYRQADEEHESVRRSHKDCRVWVLRAADECVNQAAPCLLAAQHPLLPRASPAADVRECGCAALALLCHHSAT